MYVCMSNDLPYFPLSCTPNTKYIDVELPLSSYLPVTRVELCRRKVKRNEPLNQGCSGRLQYYPYEYVVVASASTWYYTVMRATLFPAT